MGNIVKLNISYKLQCSTIIIGTIATNYPRTNERQKIYEKQQHINRASSSVFARINLIKNLLITTESASIKEQVVCTHYPAHAMLVT